MSSDTELPILYVEGKDDISVISALLLRHGVDTARGAQMLKIKDLGDIDTVLTTMPEATKASTDRPVGFVIDIDVTIVERWKTVCSYLVKLGISPPQTCPKTGYLAQLPDYPNKFGLWLMPDCATDDAKLESLIESLLPNADPLWPHAKGSVTEAAKIVELANSRISIGDDQWQRFRDVDRIKAEVHTWLAWQRVPGAPLGAAINDRILGHDSPQALAFLRWIKDLYGFSQLASL